VGGTSLNSRIGRPSDSLLLIEPEGSQESVIGIYAEAIKSSPPSISRISFNTNISFAHTETYTKLSFLSRLPDQNVVRISHFHINGRLTRHAKAPCLPAMISVTTWVKILFIMQFSPLFCYFRFLRSRCRYLVSMRVRVERNFNLKYVV
jgi:hypothetical protein